MPSYTFFCSSVQKRSRVRKLLFVACGKEVEFLDCKKYCEIARASVNNFHGDFGSEFQSFLAFPTVHKTFTESAKRHWASNVWAYATMPPEIISLKKEQSVPYCEMWCAVIGVRQRLENRNSSNKLSMVSSTKCSSSEIWILLLLFYGDKVMVIS